MNINLNLYKYFFIVAKNLSFTKASEELLVSQPSLSYSIKTLEDQLGYKLFDRTSQGIFLTTKGKNLYDQLFPIMAKLDNIESDNIEGNLILGVPSLYHEKILPKYLNKIYNNYPDLYLDLSIRHPYELGDDLQNNKVDMIIDETYFNGDKFVSKLVRESNFRLALIVGADYYNQYKKINTLEDIAKKQLLVCSANKFTEKLMRQYPSLDYKDVYNTSFIIENVKHHDAIGIVPITSIQNELDNGILKILNIDFELPNISMYVTYLKQNENKNLIALSSVFTNYSFDDLL